MITDKILKYLSEEGKTLDRGIAYEVGRLAQWSFERQFMRDEEDTTKGKIRLSSVGRCPRQNAYKYHGFEVNGKERDGRSCLTFFAGDIAEIAILQIAKVAVKKNGEGCLVGIGLDQAVVRFEVDGTMIEGHPDGLWIENKAIILIECKSMSSFGFEKLQRGVIDDAYLAQINAYLEALGLTHCVLIGYNKNNNVLHEVLIKKDPKIVEICRKNVSSVLTSSPKTLPEAPTSHDLDKKGCYPWMCLYCPFWGHCRPNAEKVLVGTSYKLKERLHHGF